MKPITQIAEIQIHYVRPRLSEMLQVTSLNEVEQVFATVIDFDRIDLKEFFWVMLLTRTNHVLGVSEIAIGDTADIAVCKKEIFQLALKANASSVILCHNHPSGNIQPSQADISLTKEIVDFGAIIGLAVLDHFIVTSEGWFSFRNEGVL